MLRRGAWLAAAIALALSAPAAAQAMPGTLSINDGAPVRVASAASVRRTLRRCARPGGCTSLMLETCDRCILSAQAERGGFAIRSRLGPPGPEYNLFHNRPERGRGVFIFTAAELTEIFAGHVSGVRPLYVRSILAPAEEETE